MTHVLEYIMQHYTLFLGGIILILLAIIGYYADKTNFGQGKKSETKKETNDNYVDVENVGLSDIINNENLNNIEKENGVILEADQSSDQFHQNLQEEAALTSDPSLLEQNINTSENQSVNNDSNSLDINNERGNNNLAYNSDIILNAKDDMILNTQNYISEIKEDEQNNNLEINEEAFNKFSDEFNSILPKKELISMDLLSDIDDLELGKTQKIDLSSVPDLDDIELPKIKKLPVEEEDVWKF